MTISGAQEGAAKLEGVGAASDNAAAKLGLLAGGAAIIAGAAIIGIGLKAVKMAGDFQAGLTTLITGAGELPKNLALVGNGILNIAVQTGTATAALISAMFLIESAGYHGAAGLQILQIAAEGAKVGNADLTQTTDVLTTALHDYNLPASQAVQVMNSLIEAVKNGKMTMDDLNASLTNVLPVAAAFHINLSDVESALSVMAASGDKGASAGTHLAMMFKMLENPASTAQKAMAAMGIDSIKLAQTLNTSLPNALQMIQNAVAQHFTPGSVEYNRAIATILGGSKSGVAGLELMSGGLKGLQSDMTDTAKALHTGGTAVTGWALVQQDFNQKMAVAGEVMETLGIKVGTILMPYVTQLLGAIVPLISRFGAWLIAGGNLQRIITGLGSGFSTLGTILHGVITVISDIIGFFQKNQWAVDLLVGALSGVTAGFTAAGIAAVVGMIPALITQITLIPTMVGLMGLWIAAQWALLVPVLATAAPFIAIGIVVAAVVVGVIEAIQHWGAITQWLGNVWTTVFTWVGSQFSKVGAFLHGVIDDIGNAFSSLGSLVHGVWEGIVGAIKSAINFIIGLINWFISGIDKIHVDIGPVHIGFDIPTIPYLQSGGFITSPGLAFLHAGESVVPAGGWGAGVSSGGPPIIVRPPDIYLDGVRLSRGLMPYVANAIRYNVGGFGR